MAKIDPPDLEKQRLTEEAKKMKTEHPLKIAIDLDGTISEYPQFFSLLTSALAAVGSIIYVVTDRPPQTEDHVAAELKTYRITYHHIKITSDKAAFITSNGISVLLDDMDRYFRELPPHVAVFKVRQKYNFDFVTQRWFFGNEI